MGLEHTANLYFSLSKINSCGGLYLLRLNFMWKLWLFMVQASSRKFWRNSLADIDNANYNWKSIYEHVIDASFPTYRWWMPLNDFGRNQKCYHKRFFRSWRSKPAWRCFCQWPASSWCCPTENCGDGSPRGPTLRHQSSAPSIPWMCLKNFVTVSK